MPCRFEDFEKKEKRSLKVWHIRYDTLYKITDSEKILLRRTANHLYQSLEVVISSRKMPTIITKLNR